MFSVYPGDKLKHSLIKNGHVRREAGVSAPHTPWLLWLKPAVMYVRSQIQLKALHYFSMLFCFPVFSEETEGLMAKYC